MEPEELEPTQGHAAIAMCPPFRVGAWHLVKAMATSSMQFQQTTQAFIKNLKMQMGQMAKEISEIKAHGSGKLPSQSLLNPRENASAITLRSGRTLDEPINEPIPQAEPILPHSYHETTPPKPKNAPKVSFKEPLVTHILLGPLE